jgi:hypothetical protein
MQINKIQPNNVIRRSLFMIDNLMNVNKCYRLVDFGSIAFNNNGTITFPTDADA